MAAPQYGRRRERGLLAFLAQVVQELRYPTTPRGKIIAVSLAVVVFSFVSLVVLGGFFLSRVLNPFQAEETIDPVGLLGNAQSVPFNTADGEVHNGWFFPGLRGGPVVILCHGYKSSRSEILTLATSLQQHRYNVYTFNFAGHGESPIGYTTLGYRETEELEAAIRMIQERTDVDGQRIGLWGYSLGGYVALRVAADTPAVKALAVDSIYPRPSALLRWELKHLGANTLPTLTPITVMEFDLFTLPYRGPSDLGSYLERLAGKPKLFIAGDDTPHLSEMTKALFQQAPGPKEMMVLPRTNMGLLIEDERRNYENLLVTFFLRTLPLVAPHA